MCLFFPLSRHPNDTLYLNDLGVSEMRIRDWQRAKLRFINCIKLEPQSSDCKENLQSIKDFLPKAEFDLKLKNEYPQV